MDFYLPIQKEYEKNGDSIGGCEEGGGCEVGKGSGDGCEKGEVCVSGVCNNGGIGGFEEVDDSGSCEEGYIPGVCSNGGTGGCGCDIGSDEDIGSCVDGNNFSQKNSQNPSNDKPVKTSLEDRRIGSIYLERRSLIVFRGDVFEKCLHGIRECEKDEIDEKVVNRVEGNEKLIYRKNTRVSLTIRVVPKTYKASKIFGKVKIR